MALTMAVNDMVELNVAVTWSLKKDGLTGLIKEVKNFAGTVSILYDHNYVHDCGVFTINCRARHEEDIEESIHSWLENIEEDIEDNEEEQLSEYTGALLMPMPTNPWIVRSLDATALEDLREIHKNLRMPDSILQSQYSFVWEFPRSATSYTVDDFVTSQQLAEIAECVDVVETDLFGTEIYFGAENRQACSDFHEKLDVLMYGKLLMEPHATHVFYTEGYRPQPGKELTFDARFLANIDEKIVRATLFDVDGPKDVAFGYTFLANGITIRLCRWDAVKAFDVSFIGPKVTPRRGSVAQLHPVPYVPAKVVQHSNRLPQTDKIKDKPDALANVQNWVSNTELHEFELFPGLTTSMESRRYRVQENQAFTDLEGLSFASGAPASVTSDVTEEQEKSTSDKVVPVNVNDAAPPPMTGWGKQFASKKKPVAPPRGHVTDRPASRASSTPQTRQRTPSVTGTVTTDNSSRTGRHTGVKISKEIHSAVSKLVLKGPYLRGKMTLRFELGRIIIVGMDGSGLSFNMPSTRSNGWVKSKMITNLKHADNDRSVLFTPILTQDGSDIEFMVKMTDLDMRQGLWKKEATETKIYSFFCRHRHNGADDYFFIEIEAAKKNHPSAQTDTDMGYVYSLRTENDDKRPIWIHGTMRSWDARIVMSHTDTYGLEVKYGAFAKHVASMLPLNMASMPRFTISSPPTMQILAMRVKTLWRFSGPDDASVLNVTEVRQVTHKVLACPREECNCTGAVYEFDLKSTLNNTQASDESQDLGMWYEAFITSTAAEQALAKNEAVQLGQMAAWNYEHLKQEKAIEALIKPGLRMLQLMDSVGAHNDNHLMHIMRVPTANHHQYGSTVPGANYIDDEPRGSMSAVPENDMLEVDKFEQTAYPPLSVRGPVKLAAAVPSRAKPRREIASYRLSTKPTTDGFVKEVPKQVPQVASRSSSVESPRRPATYQQQSSLRPQNRFW